jgi:hypothetical protein
MAKDKKTLGDVLRQAIWDSELTDYRIAKNAGVGPEMVGRFKRGSDCRISTVGKIAEVLGLELRPMDQ